MGYSRAHCETGASLLAEPWKLWFAVVCIHLLLMVDSTQAGRNLQQQAPKQRRLQAYTDSNSTEPRHAPPVKSFLVSDGSWVDCIPIEGQIAAHHPSLKDHIIQMAPSSPRRASSTQPQSSKCHPQLFAREHGSCPEGSIPVLREDPMSRFIRKTRPPIFQRPGGVTTQSTDPAVAAETHEYAITGVPFASSTYSGAHSIFSVNAPILESPNDDMSLSQIWVVDGSYDDNSLSTIEVGWQTQPVLHPNNEPLAPHLFIFWTNNAYAHTGPGSCYNVLNCPGFVQMSNSWVIGGAMPHYTTLDQNAQSEFEVEIEVLYDPTDMNWWLYLDNEPIGYWPLTLYVNGKLQGTANRVQWGGEVAFLKYPTVLAHTTTTMGSGAFPSDGYPVAAYQRSVSYADASGNIVVPDPLLLQAAPQRSFNNPLCYDIQVNQLGDYANWGTYFFFGGSGGSNVGCHY